MKTINVTKRTQEDMQNPWGSDIIVATNADGDLMKIPFEEVVSTQWDEIEDGETITVSTTEGIETWPLSEIVFIGDFEQWCKDNEITLNITG